MRVCGKLLRPCDVLRFPVEEETYTQVDDLDVQGRVDDGLPQGRRSENTSTAKHEEQYLWGRLDECIRDAISQAWRRHGRRKGNEDVDLLIQFRVDRQGCKSLRRALGESDIGERCLARVSQDVLYAIGNVMEGKFVDREVPKFQRRRFRGY